MKRHKMRPSQGVRLVVFWLASVATVAVHAQEVYRWVDDRATSNVSDRVPEQYRSTAQRVGSKQIDRGESQCNAAAVPAAAPARRVAALSEVRAPHLLSDQLAALKPERPGIVDVYAITYSPYAEEDVFRRESAMVASVMKQRFGAEGRMVQLVNNRDTVRQLPGATVANLQRAIHAMAALMNRNEDILFIHLTSHGAADGVLSAQMGRSRLEPVTPAKLRRWLDEAGVRYRMISVSACFSGSWIAPLAGEDTLVMTAADAAHTSYGCGRGSALTFFGRAMFDEQLRRTWSFEEAHAAARVSIDERERAAGKRDGYSNPQIRVGAGIKARLARLATERASAPLH